ncbi:recombinase [Vibrio phage vB_VpaM_VPs20]|uniref:Recombinase n=1 Tax=Vibrio phage vB_VpaM_VPs20 TaxID=2978980 RepID=A0A9X9JPM8_9CAUD|nr:recombinase [Vibrio phage vB_VpaM_VPs20]UYD72111.1 recombinase [Vibrio phage vB_VpaM_VPs20]
MDPLSFFLIEPKEEVNTMDITNQMLSDITVFNKYAKFQSSYGRRETWHELVTRNMMMHINKHPALEDEIRSAYKFVFEKKVLPSMRSLQFGGRPIEVAHNRIYNCAYLPIDHPDAFSELMFLLLGGTGGGFSVQSQHVEKLPVVQGTNGEVRRFVVGDSIEGWADCVKVLVEAYFLGKHQPIFDFSDIREKGAALITTGGKAPGPEPLKLCASLLEEKLKAAVGRRLRPIEAHDMVCIIADAVLAGGIRRAALISLFDRYDDEMLTCKSGEWWNDAPYRGRANNSATLPRGEVSYEEFITLMKIVEQSGAGEPGVYWTSNTDWGTNPCCEIGLRPFQFCNLCEVNASNVESQDDLNARARAASFIGTLQASYTNFHYLRPIWRETTEKDALIGVGMTGIGSGAVLPFDLAEAALHVKHENERAAKLMNINPAARCTTVKPSGTSSLVVGSSSGIHAWHNDFYVRRMRMGKDEALAQYLQENLPAMIEQDVFVPNGLVASFPQRAPKTAILRHESPAELLARVRRFNLEWVREGHRDGDNTHNVSCTISVKDHEWPEVTEWMWENRNDYNGISVLPYNGGTYQQAPFEDITEEQFNTMLADFKALDLTAVREEGDNTDLAGEVACGGGGCEI